MRNTIFFIVVTTNKVVKTEGQAGSEASVATDLPLGSSPTSLLSNTNADIDIASKGNVENYEEKDHSTNKEFETKLENETGNKNVAKLENLKVTSIPETGAPEDNSVFGAATKNKQDENFGIFSDNSKQSFISKNEIKDIEYKLPLTENTVKQLTEDFKPSKTVKKSPVQKQENKLALNEHEKEKKSKESGAYEAGIKDDKEKLESTGYSNNIQETGDSEIKSEISPKLPTHNHKTETTNEEYHGVPDLSLGNSKKDYIKDNTFNELPNHNGQLKGDIEIAAESSPQLLPYKPKPEVELVEEKKVKEEEEEILDTFHDSRLDETNKPTIGNPLEITINKCSCDSSEDTVSLPKRWWKKIWQTFFGDESKLKVIIKKKITGENLSSGETC
ncbi:uncharacterized protein LOC142327535 isoform X2 [Lycorma delicatula]|uniref:uncharacterized protein LOC142327535 isoform X2 n=1 Tax=Lycorma delicatula TaxID=130591 RepID=UPI003F5174E3